MKIRNKNAFTMIEIMVVIFIIGMILATVGPRMAKWWTQADETDAKLRISNIKAALNDYRAEFGMLPTTRDGLHALVESTRPGDERFKRAEREGKFPFVPKGEEGIVDKAGVEFIYHCPPEVKKDKYKFYEILWVGKTGTEDEPNIDDGV